MKKTLIFSCGVIFLILLAISGDYAEGLKENIILVPVDYLTIQEAVDAAEPGDTIKVQKGEYAGAFIYNKHVKIIGSGPNTLITEDNPEPNWDGDGFTILGELASGTEISHLAIDISSFTFPYGYVPVGIDIYGANDVTVSHVEIRNTTYIGIVALLCEDVQITHNEIIGFPEAPWGRSSGILLSQCKSSLVALNKIKSLSDDQASATGIYLYSRTRETKDNTVVHNKIEVKTDADYVYAIFLQDRTILSEEPCEDLYDNLIGFNDLRGSEKYIGFNPECLLDVNIITRNLGNNCRYQPLPEGYGPEDFRPGMKDHE